MESNIKGLVAAGHEMASELKAECGAVDMRSVAKLISDLATQLEVQLVRANALAAAPWKALTNSSCRNGLMTTGKTATSLKSVCAAYSLMHLNCSLSLPVLLMRQ